MKERQVSETLKMVMNGRNISIEAQRRMKIILFILLDLSIRDMDMECITIVIIDNRNELRKRVVWVVEMGWEEQ